MRDRTFLVLELINNPRPDALVMHELAAHGPDCDKPLAMVSRAAFIKVLRQFEQGALSAPELKAWATRLVGRKDINFEFGEEGVVEEALFWLVHKEYHDWANDQLCQHLETMLERRSHRRD